MTTTERPLTARQLQLLRFLWHSVRTTGTYPSVREMAAHMKVGSTNGVECHLRQLARRGLVLLPGKNLGPVRLAGVRLVPALESSEAGRRLAALVEGDVPHRKHAPC